MIIKNSSMNMYASHALEKHESLSFSRRTLRGPALSFFNGFSDALKLSGEHPDALSEQKTGEVKETKPDEMTFDDYSAEFRFKVLKFVLSLLFFKMQGGDCGEEGLSLDDIARDMAGERAYDITEQSYQYSESEYSSFSAQGACVTADGRVIDFSVNLEMSREFMTRTDMMNIRERALADPLIIHYSGDPRAISDQTFFFDIDCDGEEDELSSIAPGSGFLALDKNGNGQIDDGSELFGALSGDGFADLSKHDGDGNGWIDEADDIWSKLLIYSVDADGNKTLMNLKEAGIGAIGLPSADTEFSEKDNSNNTLGVIRRTGIFLHEDGRPGLVRQVDLAKR